ncbi:nicotinate-nucleotide adenylyltransferase [Neptunicella marina]|uniref:Probable nicotinate-nucleotide adenylyltransferase n=1 Tax=Neptunicella marina TaxID=2125989 RepID=A0A8J6IS31_9ALTE|nr:nicotinate-nucleotide adenylyltransferase [Neptunicella marina]MBC3764561.1 nicotinate-nucleotide adenylyltransferase [Neptunicella marina]
MLGILGGTFDPIHSGHILPAEQAANLLGISKVLLMPCHIPPHRETPEVTASQRLEMVRLACENHPLFEADDTELKRNSASYTVETLSQLKQKYPAKTLCFFMGMDSLNQFTQWFRWQDILDLAHLVVCARPGYQQDVPPVIQKRIITNTEQARAAFAQHNHGRIYIAEVSPVDCAATNIRQQLASGQAPFTLLDNAVAEYIQQHRLYQNRE